MHIDTPNQVYTEYHINHKSGISGKQGPIMNRY